MRQLLPRNGAKPKSCSPQPQNTFCSGREETRFVLYVGPLLAAACWRVSLAGASTGPTRERFPRIGWALVSTPTLYRRCGSAYAGLRSSTRIWRTRRPDKNRRPPSRSLRFIRPNEFNCTNPAQGRYGPLGRPRVLFGAPSRRGYGTRRGRALPRKDQPALS